MSLRTQLKAHDVALANRIESELRVFKSRLALREAALNEVIKACEADCGINHIKWLAKQGLK
jgi:hypothetical protein